MVHSNRLTVATSGHSDMHDLTDDVAHAITTSGVHDGIVTVFVVGSTAGVTTMEFEPGLVEDMGRVLEAIAPADASYAHEARWHDDNGHSHVRSSLIGPSVTVPFNARSMDLGMWQQIVLIDFDTRPRERTVVVQIIGE